MQSPQRNLRRLRLIYHKLSQCALILTLVLGLTAVWSVWTYCGYGQGMVQQVNGSNLLQATQYYDANRNAAGVNSVRWVSATGACPAGYTNTSDLYVWPGNVAGCQVNSSVRAGACHHHHKAVVGTPVAAHAAVNLTAWRGKGQLCLRRSNHSLGMLRATGAACPAGSVGCGACQCRNATAKETRAMVCPLTQLRLNTKAGAAPLRNCHTGTVLGGVHAQCANVEGGNDLVGVEVNMFGLPCRAPGLHQKHPNVSYPLLLKQGAGCGLLEQDKLSSVVDETKDEFFLNGNVRLNSVWNQTVVDLGDAYMKDTVLGQNGSAVLVGRHRVPTKCNAACDAFRFGKNAVQVVGSFNHVWGRLAIVCYIAGVGCLFTMLLLLFVVLRQRTSSQDKYAFLFGLTLLVMLIVFLLLVLLAREVSHMNTLRAPAVTADKSECVQDEGWGNVLRQYVERTNLQSLHVWACMFATVTGVYLVGGVVTLVWGTRQMGQRYELIHNE